MTEAEQNHKRPAPNATTLDEDALLAAAIADAGRESAMLDEAAPAEASNKERFLAFSSAHSRPLAPCG
jgi:hypothetical protein